MHVRGLWRKGALSRLQTCVQKAPHVLHFQEASVFHCFLSCFPSSADGQDAVYMSCTFTECCQLVHAPWSVVRLSCSWPDTHTHIQVVRWTFPQRGPCGTMPYQVTFTKRLTQSSGHCKKKASALYNVSNVSCLQPQPLRCDPICESLPRRFMKPLCKNGTILQLVG